MTRIIYTLNDAREERELAELHREHRRAIKEARQKVKHWERRDEKFGGEIQRETLERMRQRLVELEEGTMS